VSAEPKPLAVGDRVRRREAMVVTTISDGLVWTDCGTVWCPSEVERIDPTSPADPADDARPAETDDERVAHWIAAIRTLTAERDAAIARAERAAASAGIDFRLADLTAQVLALVDDRATLTAERDAARAEVELMRAEEFDEARNRK
jgi:hypothetical protein